MKNWLRSVVFALLALCPVAAFADTAALTWTANTETDLAGYKVYQSTTSGVYGAALTTLGKVTAHNITLPTLTVDTRYYFTITAYDLAGNESPKSNEVSKVALVAPGTPVLTLTALSANSFRITWSNVIAVDGSVALLDIRFATSPITWGTATSISCPSSPCTVTGLSPTTTYQVQAVAFRVNNSVVGFPSNVFGAISAPVSVTTLAVDLPPAAPAGVTVR